MPDIPARVRFSPFLFNGVTFSTGSSAEFGQAFSLVVYLQTNALADENITSIFLTRQLSKSAITVDGNYSNLCPYFLMSNHDLDWTKVPESYEVNARYRLKTAKNGLLKAMIKRSYSRSALYDKFLIALLRTIVYARANQFMLM